MSFTGGGGGSHEWRTGLWVFPLPPPGTLKVFFALPAAGIEETTLTLNADDIRAAAARAHVIWD